ncbi:MAG TPA: uracil-DNA glycosylase [Gemmatimonadaceae bacterium]|nr:uracil-DNA glycosylase [Gemmatimonadaceae bacterium]
MRAEQLLRRYLEQRRELGEQDLVLDGMTVDQVMHLVGAGGRAPPPARVDERPASPRVAESTPDATWRELLEAQPAEPRVEEVKVARAAPLQPSGSAIFETPQLDDLAALVRECTRCPLYRSATHAVPGEGNARARLMCVGEAPGAQEDASGRPFVGQAGQLLTKILAAIKLQREDVFIANVLKHRPPGNRNPLPNEVEACSPYLVRQIQLIRPSVILALGTFAAQTLLETKLSIGKLRGTVHQYHDIPVVVTYHPAALLRNPAWKRSTWEDVQLARRILDSASA